MQLRERKTTSLGPESFSASNMTHEDRSRRKAPAIVFRSRLTNPSLLVARSAKYSAIFFWWATSVDRTGEKPGTFGGLAELVSGCKGGEGSSQQSLLARTSSTRSRTMFVSFFSFFPPRRTARVWIPFCRSTTARTGLINFLNVTAISVF